MTSVLIVAVALCAAYIVVFLTDQRSARDVLDDLARSDDEISEESKPRESRRKKSDNRKQIFLFFLLALVLIVLKFVFFMPTEMLVVLGGMGAALLYLLTRYIGSRKPEHDIEGIEYHLPLIMEQLVMAVQSGYDVFSALKVVLDTEIDVVEHKRSPMYALLLRTRTLIESGLTVEEALKEVSHTVPSPALRHAFLHLAIAHREGGELVRPLRELSDATQLYYQETVEERIAKLPVKATVPLVITFAGLLLMFLTSPLIKVMEMTSKGVPGAM